MMIVSRRLIVLGAAAFALSCATPTPAALTLEDILARNAEAQGGAAFARVQTLLSEAEIVEPTFTVEGRYIASKTGLMRVDVFYQGRRAFSEGIDAQGAWSWPGDAPAPVPASGSGRAMLAHGIEFNLFSLVELSR